MLNVQDPRRDCCTLYYVCILYEIESLTWQITTTTIIYTETRIERPGTIITLPPATPLAYVIEKQIDIVKKMQASYLY